MGRLKKSQEEKDEKRRERQRRYYERHKETIRIRRMEVYWGKKNGNISDNKYHK
jgi:hypothetical protein